MQHQPDSPFTDWPPHRVTAEVKMRGATMKDLSIQAGLPAWACQTATAKRHPPGEQAIADFLGVKVWEIWPSRWRAPETETGTPTRIDHRRRADQSAA